MTQRKVIRKTKIYNADDQYRNDAPVGMFIEGRQDGTRWVCIFATSSPVVMKIGWWVNFMDTVALTAPLPEPEPTTDPADFMVHYRVVNGQPVAVERFEKVIG